MPDADHTTRLVKALKDALAAGPLAWLIECTNNYGEKFAMTHRHNSIGDYRVADPKATSTPLYALDLVALLEALEVAQVDARRLDFLIADECQVWEYNGRFAVHKVTEHEAITPEFNDARKAIDAAIALQEGKTT